MSCVHEFSLRMHTLVSNHASPASKLCSQDIRLACAADEHSFDRRRHPRPKAVRVATSLVFDAHKLIRPRRRFSQRLNGIEECMHVLCATSLVFAARHR